MIEIERLTADASEQCTVFFSNGETMEISREELCAFHMREGNRYTEEEQQALLTKILCERAKSKVMPFVTFSRRTGGQVSSKIVALGFPDAVAALLVEELTEKGYLDDKAYCLSYIRRASGEKNYSRERIFADLRAKGVSERDLAEAFETLSPDEAETARRVLNKRLRTGGERDYNKLYAFLLRKGFSGETVRKVLQEIRFEEGK